MPLSVALSAAKGKENRENNWGDLDNSEIMTQANVEHTNQNQKIPSDKLLGHVKHYEKQIISQLRSAGDTFCNRKPQ